MMLEKGSLDSLSQADASATVMRAIYLLVRSRPGLDRNGIASHMMHERAHASRDRATIVGAALKMLRKRELIRSSKSSLCRGYYVARPASPEDFEVGASAGVFFHG